MTTKTQATVEDLYRIPDNGKAEVVNGEIVLMSPTGDMPGRAGGAIYVSLRGVERRAGVLHQRGRVQWSRSGSGRRPAQRAEYR